MPAQKPREIAVKILLRRAEKEGFLENLVDAELSAAGLSAADRGLVQELTYGAVRWEALLDWLVARQASQPKQKLGVQIILRLGLYQILWLDRIPDHAAIHETVELAHAFGCGAQAGFVNGLLREYLRNREATKRLMEQLREADPALGYSHPSWLCHRWEARWGRDALRRLLEWNNSPAPTFARLNTLRMTAAQLTALWKAEGVEHQARQWDWTGSELVYEIEPPQALVTLPSFQQGGFYVQDPSTLLAVRMLDPQPEESVLDVCAAPGGKTTLMAQFMQNRGYIMAQDLDIYRRNAIKENCDRLGVKIVSISRATTAINYDLSEPYDRVLVDVPCTNTGVMRRRVDLRWRVQPEGFAELGQLQETIMGRAVAQVRPGGCLVYSTCSLEPEENEQRVRALLAQHPEFELEQERQLVPFVDGVDGAYVARLRRRG